MGDKIVLKHCETLQIDSVLYLLKTLATTVFKIVPHTIDIERLFCKLGGIHRNDRINLSVQNLKRLAIITKNCKEWERELRSAIGLKNLENRHTEC